MAIGAIGSFAIAARRAQRGADPIRLCGAGAVLGMFGFAMIIFSAPMQSAALLMLGALLIGFGNGLFSIGTLLRVMALPNTGENGLALGAWGAVQATAAGLAMAIAGGIRDGVTSMMPADPQAITAVTPGAGYLAAYLLAVAGLLVLLVVLGPLAARSRADVRPVPFGIAEFPA
jgi:BCD family chlorophyll transporter-like MFS transporter